MDTQLQKSAYGAALLLGVLPLWAGATVPMVDLPQHLHLISVLHRLADPTTLYPEVFATRGQLTPYLGYYYLVSLLNWLFPLGIANKVFLSAYVAGLPLSMAFLLRSLKRPAWPSLLALPFAYGDSFAWGFVNYCSALPFTFLTCGLFVRAVGDPARRRRWAAGLAATLVAVLLFHVQAFAYLAVALPALLLMTRAPDASGRNLRAQLAPRLPALLGVLPGVLLFVAWIGLRLGEPSEVEAGAPWKAWGPMLSSQNLSYKSFEQNRHELFSVLANMFRDGSDRYALYAVGAVAGLALVLGLLGGRQPSQEGPVERWRMLVLAGLALALFFLLPFDIRGYIYYLNTRYAHLAAPLVLGAVPALTPRLQRPLTLAAAACALVLALPLYRGFKDFSTEASALDDLVQASAPKARVMGMIFDTGSASMTHPMFLHSATVLARERGGLANFSFALTPHSPLKYRGPPPPTFPSEWNPGQFRWAEHGPAYDHFLIRGADPGRIFGPLLSSELSVVAQSGRFSLIRRR